ncbi:serine/threonine protein kinase [Mastigocladopsis repens]|uniref:serine/threonine protein kinase n=1 Tax=Mastigocladopsis repens TaxID=221287 RepID=UPI00031F13AE|nr:serine/threonine protein kinase [Mastigocladopsis repens]
MIGSLLDQRYQVVELLGKGGFGHTYIAQDTRRPGNPTCVVKHLKPATNDPDFLQTARRLFRREAEALEKLGNHDQIPRLLAYFEENEEFFLVQEFIDGHQLSLEMSPGTRWDESQVIQLLYEILPILDFIHNNDVIHRDLKPQNIIRRHSDNKLVLVDFGAVKQVKMYSLMSPEQQIKNETISIGTPGYMSSEQAQGRPRPNSDIYALGMIAIQGLTGLSPKQLAEDPTTGEIIWRQYAQVSDPLAAIITKMVRQYYKYRFHFADEALEALTSITHPNTPTAAAAAVSYVVRNYLREGYVSANKMVQSLQKLAKPCYIPPDNTTAPETTQQSPSPSQSTVKISPVNSPISPNSSPTRLGFLNQYRRKLPLLIAAGGGLVLVVFSIISASPPSQQPSRLTAENNKIQDTTKETTDKNTTEAIQEQNNCVVVTRSSNLRSTSHRRTGKVIKAGTKVTVTGKKEGGWLEISAPEEGWIWGSRTKNTCPTR